MDPKKALAINRAFKALNDGVVGKDDGSGVLMISSGTHEGYVIQDLERFVRSVKSMNAAKREILASLAD